MMRIRLERKPQGMVIGDESFSNLGGSNDCYAFLKPSGFSLSGKVSCKGMISDKGKKIDVNVQFECSVKTL